MSESVVCSPYDAVSPPPLERVEAQIVELASQLTAATARLLELVGVFDAAEGWRDYGMRSTAHWLAWRCGLGLVAGREQVRVARALRDLPSIRAGFAAGRLSYSKVRALTRLATPATEAELVGVAEAATAAQLETLVRHHRRAVRACDARARRDAEQLSYHVAEDGSLVGSFRIAPERAVLVLHALDAAAGRVPDPVGEGDPHEQPAERRARLSRVDGLVALCEQSLDRASAEASSESAERYQLVVHVPVAALERSDDADDADRDGALLTAAGGSAARVHPATVRRLGCDCPTSTMVEGVDGSAVHVGRTTRRIRGRLRRAVQVRDRGRCRAPGCSARATQIHHRRHWADGGPTCLPNLVSLCDGHHWQVHEGGFTLVDAGPNRWALLSPAGVTVPPVPDVVEAVTPLPVDPAVAPDAVAGAWIGDRMSHVTMVGWLFDAERAELKRAPQGAEDASAEAFLDPSSMSSEHGARYAFPTHE